MLKLTIPLTLILLLVSGSNGQTPETAQDYLKSGMAHFQRGEIDSALADANKALELNSNYVDALFLRAALRIKKGDSAGLLADYNKIIELVPSSPGVEVIYTNRSTMRLQSKDIDGALDDLNKAVSLNPKEGEIYAARAVARLQKRDSDGALADYEKALELKPSLPSAFLGRGSFRFMKKDFDRALLDFSKAIEFIPDYADAYVYRGIVRGMKGDIDGAVEDMKKGAGLNPRSVSDSDRGNFISPFIELNQFITENPNDARGYEMRGMLRLFQRKVTEAAQDFNKGVELDPLLKSEIEAIRRVKVP
jgi:tetratricopeptide (TPR) repeat protein